MNNQKSEPDARQGRQQEKAGDRSAYRQLKGSMPADETDEQFDAALAALRVNNPAGSAPQQEPEICICAAVQLPDGYIVRGHRHTDCFRTIGGIPRYSHLHDGEYLSQGFVTSSNRFVGRKEAASLQIAAGIESKDLEHPYLHGECYSEDLY